MTKIKQTKRAGYKEACELLRRAYKESDYNFSERMTDSEAMSYICEALFDGASLCRTTLSSTLEKLANKELVRGSLRAAFFVLASRNVDFKESDFYELPQVHFENKSMSTICYELSRVLPFNDTPTMRDKLLKIFVRQLFELAFFVGIDVLSVD